MPRLPAMKPREVVRILQREGFLFVRQKGSHCIYVKASAAIVIPWHNRDLKTGTLRKIISQLGMTVEEFLRRR